MAIKLDLEKAYDVLDWIYIRACLLQFGFCSDWCNKIMNFINSSSFSNLLKGTAHGNFTASREIT